MKWLLAFVLCVSLAGCSGPDVDSLEQDVLNACNSDFEKDGSVVRGTSVQLVQETDTKFTGVLYLSDGQKMPISVIWRGHEMTYSTR
jgi:hypothetical protein